MATKKQHKKWSQNDIDLPMHFENAVSQFLGITKAHQTNHEFSNDKSFRKLFRQCIPVILKRIDCIDTLTENKKALFSVVNELNNSLVINDQKTEREIIVRLFLLVSYLLGLRSGKSVMEIICYQTCVQYFNQHGANKYNNDDKNVIIERTRLYKELKTKGWSDFQIALLFNKTEYEIKKLNK